MKSTTIKFDRAVQTSELRTACLNAGRDLSYFPDQGVSQVEKTNGEIVLTLTRKFIGFNRMLYTSFENRSEVREMKVWTGHRVDENTLELITYYDLAIKRHLRD